MIHPRLLEELHNFYPSVCVIEKAASTTDAYKGEVLTWSTRYDNVSCTVAPTKGREVKRPDMTYVVATHHVALAGYYPFIIEKDRVLVDGLVLDILLVEHDSPREMTRLACEVVK